MGTGIIRRLLSAGLACMLGSACYAVRAETVQAVQEPTCTASGYRITTDPARGVSTVENLPAVGHDWPDWTTDAAAGVQRRICAACGYEEQVRISSIPMESIAALYLTGSLEGVGKKQKVTLEAEFRSPEQSFACYGVMTMQGHSTFGYLKHNYTLRLYNDAREQVKYKVQFGTGRKEHKYILKANYLDLSQCRNLAGARIWRSMTACREGLHPRIAALPTLGAVEGFPVMVYLNGGLHGLYTMNLHKDGDLYGMREGERAALVICNRETSPEALFRAPAVFDEDARSDWEIEFCGTKNDAWVRQSFNGLIDFVMTASDGDFRDQIRRRLDVDAAVDYLILIYALGLPHSGAKDLVMLSYGDVWMPSAYDMDQAFGLDAESGRYLSPEEFLPQKTDGVWSSGTGSLLWDRLLNAFEKEVCARYAELRGHVLSRENLLRCVEEFVSGIPETCYDLDANLYPNRPLNDRNMQGQITTYITRRLEALDAALEVNVP